MRQRICEIAVIRQQQNTGRIVIETSNRHEPHRLRTALLANEVSDGAPSFRIAHRRNDADRFVQYQHLTLRHDDRAAIDFDPIAVFDARAQLAHELPVDAHFTGDDQFLRGAPRCYSGKREIALQSHGDSDTRPLNHLLPRA